jgi:calcineurin-like phosphoesterase family protein
VLHEKWFISDTHFFHDNILKFIDDKGHKIRGDTWANVEDMNETILKNWNSVVKENDYVYHLGDVTFKYDGSFNNLMSRLNGKKRLIIGNHDKVWNPCLQKWFEKAELWKGFSDDEAGIAFTASHFPLPQYGLRNGKYNAHGHIHQNPSTEAHQLNLSVEVINYTPVHIDKIVEEFKQRES